MIIVRQPESGNTKSLVSGADNIIAALGCRGHVCKVCFPFVSSRSLEGLATLMQELFPRAVASEAPFEHVTTLERPPTFGLLASPRPPPPPSSRDQPSSLCLFQIPPHLSSNLATDNTQIAQNCQHNSRAAPRGRRTGSKHDSCSTSPVEPLFGTTALSDRIVAYRFSTLFRTFYCIVFLKLSELPLAFPLIP